MKFWAILHAIWQNTIALPAGQCNLGAPIILDATPLPGLISGLMVWIKERKNNEQKLCSSPLDTTKNSLDQIGYLLGVFVINFLMLMSSIWNVFSSVQCIFSSFRPELLQMYVSCSLWPHLPVFFCVPLEMQILDLMSSEMEFKTKIGYAVFLSKATLFAQRNSFEYLATSFWN